MTLQQALSYTGNEYQSMTYEELAEVTKALAEAARKRIKRVSEGPAYEKLRRKATGAGLTKRANALTYDNGNIKISQKFKGKNRMSMSDLRTLRKELTDYMRDPTSTKKGLDQHKEYIRKKMEENVVRGEDIGDISDIWNDFYSCETNTELIHFAERRLDWGSSQIYSAIIECGGYEDMFSNSKSFTENFKKYLKNIIDDMETDDPDFFDSYENHIDVNKPSWMF